MINIFKIVLITGVLILITAIFLDIEVQFNFNAKVNKEVEKVKEVSIYDYLNKYHDNFENSDM